MSTAHSKPHESHPTTPAKSGNKATVRIGQRPAPTAKDTVRLPRPPAKPAPKKP